MRIIAFSNQKGGVAKTTSSYAMAVGLANRGYKVLVVDSDPQENLSMTAGIDLNEIDPDPDDIERLSEEQQRFYYENVPAKLYEVMAAENDKKSGYKDINKAIIPISENLDLIVGGIDLASADMTFANLGRERLIDRAFKKLNKTYDFCIFDCSPALGVVLMNILTLADAKIWMEDIESKAKMLGTKVYRSKIRLNVSVEEAQTMKMELFEYASGSPAARDYNDFIDEFLEENN